MKTLYRPTALVSLLSALFTLTLSPNALAYESSTAVVYLHPHLLSNHQDLVAMHQDIVSVYQYSAEGFKGFNNDAAQNFGPTKHKKNKDLSNISFAPEPKAADLPKAYSVEFTDVEKADCEAILANPEINLPNGVFYSVEYNGETVEKGGKCKSEFMVLPARNTIKFYGRS